MASKAPIIEYENEKAPALHEIVAALSFALDLTEGAVAGHSVRTCLIAMRLAESMSLPQYHVSDVYYASLLKDVGCSSNSARMCQIVGGDDRAAKAAAKLIDWTKPHKPSLETIKLMWKNVMPGAGVIAKAGRMANLAMTQHKNNKELIELRCDRGAKIVRKIGLNEAVSEAVRHLDEHWNGEGYPSGLKGHQIPLVSRLMAVAQHLDVFASEKGPQAAIDVLVERKSVWFDPQIVKVACGLHKSGKLWELCTAGERAAEAHAAVLDLDPGGRQHLSNADVDLICEAFSDVVDAKSPFTYRHSIGVKNAAVSIGKMMGMPEHRLRLLRRAALLHDVGKLSVPNSILDKPGKLTGEEFQIVKGHPALSHEILSRVGAFREIAIIAGQHHEKLDRTGYPYGLSDQDLSVESRVLTIADVYGALSEDRPYRGGLALSEISSIMEREVPIKLDSICYDALLAALQDPNLQASMEPEPAPMCEVCVPGVPCIDPDVPVKLPIAVEVGSA